MLKKIGIALVVLVAVLVAVISTRPSSYTVLRSGTTTAGPDVVYGMIADLHRWVDWSPWEKLDPAQKRTFSGAPYGKGAVFEWEGNDKIGQGRMTIVDATVPTSVALKLEFIKPFTSTNDVQFQIERGAGDTRVTWSMSGHNDFMGKAMSLFMDMDKMIGPDFERGLAELKTASEAEEKKRAEAEAAAKAAAAAADAAKAAAAAVAVAPSSAAEKAPAGK